jgi:hypothetical protein
MDSLIVFLLTTGPMLVGAFWIYQILQSKSILILLACIFLPGIAVVYFAYRLSKAEQNMKCPQCGRILPLENFLPKNE